MKIKQKVKYAYYISGIAVAMFIAMLHSISMINPENNDWPGYIIAAFVLWVGINWPEWAGFWKISDD
jgi:hypothetical protein